MRGVGGTREIWGVSGVWGVWGVFFPMPNAQCPMPYAPCPMPNKKPHCYVGMGDLYVFLKRVAN